jgi:hypothetical protein
MRNKTKAAKPKPSLTVHQIVAYNFRRAREEEGWTQAQTSDQLEPFLGYKLNQAGVSAIEKTFDSERRRNIDVAEVVAFARCFQRPIGWFFLSPPGMGEHIVECPQPRENDTFHDLPAGDLVHLVIGTNTGWTAFLGRITELLKTDEDKTWRSLRYAFNGVKTAKWETQIDLRRRALQATMLAKWTKPTDEVITSMAAVLVDLVKSTPIGFAKLRETSPEEALLLLAEGDRFVEPLIGSVQDHKNDPLRGHNDFDDLVHIDLAEALGDHDDEDE